MYNQIFNFHINGIMLKKSLKSSTKYISYNFQITNDSFRYRIHNRYFLDRHPNDNKPPRKTERFLRIPHHSQRPFESNHLSENSVTVMVYHREQWGRHGPG